MRKFNVVRNTLYTTKENLDYTMGYGQNGFMLEFGIWDLKVTEQSEVDYPTI